MSVVKPELGQVWTPDHVADKMLQLIDYNIDNLDILNSTILEPSFGEGVFLYKIYDAIINAGYAAGLSQSSIIKKLNNVWGIEYDEERFDETVKSITKWLRDRYGFEVSLPHLMCMDTLDFTPDIKFDYIVGNPPYIRVHDLPEEMRQKLKKLSSTTGTSDLYIAFYELGLSWLEEGGKLVYISPNSFFKNTSQKKMRKELLDQGYLDTIIDFGSARVFDVGAYVAIAVLSKKETAPLFFDYSKVNEKLEEKFSRIVHYSDITDTFVVPSPEEEHILVKQNSESPRLSDVAKIQNGLATLGDKYFLVTPENNPELYHSSEKHLYPVVKSSIYKGEEIKGKIVFPYSRAHGKFVGEHEDDFKQKSPLCYEHLLKNREGLEKRKRDKDSLWFWYGRSQAIQETSKRKLVFSHVVSEHQKSIPTYIIPENTLIYGGLFITELDTSLFGDKLDLEDIARIVESTEFADYCRLYGKDMSGNYTSVTAPLVKNFAYSLQE